ncbi:vacuolar protein sorting-associated protein 70 (peptidase family M28) [Colletotrichum tofieldiae]|uniref:Vacuolar protein sorting-associated protein 70 (Peptidase family M28) n=1 Tax=Colletotrichum tofieldiae TaxID=708197 RepID=A0A166Y648_9PEZI|nr:vacuolar protein sorting-associated protein 70 (peptidase family M28) [Colletotrichum tofieldiae]
MRGTLLAVVVAATGIYACQRDWDALNRRINSHSHHDHGHKKRDLAVEYPPSLTDYETILVNSFDSKSLDEWSHYYTSGDHLGGHNRTQAEWTQQKWIDAGWDASIEEYWIWYTAPLETTLRLNRPDGSIHDVSLIEDMLEEDPTTSYPNRIPAYHAMSGSGNISAEYVYVGRGQRADFQALKDAGIELEGKIALSMYGGIYRGTKVKNAQDNGMIGAVLFTDPLDDGEITVANGYLAYPDGPARNPSMIQRGSVRFSSLYSGDPSTVGYASEKDGPRNDVTPYNPTIPSVPISMKDAAPLLAALDGSGLSAAQVNRSSWVGALPNITYSSGPATGATLDMVHFMNQTVAPSWDVIGIINGTHPDEVLIIGNHRDAWVIGGAADPNSGSAVLIELAKAFGKLVERGWKPRRTIKTDPSRSILGSWDAEEFGLQGSTEWVESHLPWLVTNAVAYLNLDVAVSGPRTALSGSGEIQTVAIEMMKKVLFPEGWGVGPTLYDMWFNTTEGEIPPLGSGSDYAAFYHNGISAVSFYKFSCGALGLTRTRHYDSYTWMAKFGDPGFKIHRVMGQWLTLIAYHVADDVIIPWDLPNAGRVLRTYYEDLNETLAEDYPDLDLSPIDSAIAEFEAAAERIATVAKQALAFNDTVLIDVVNGKYRDFSRGFASAGGLPGRPTFHNVISAPGLDNGYGADVFPAVQDSLSSGNEEQAREWVEKSASAVSRAADILRI